MAVADGERLRAGAGRAPVGADARTAADADRPPPCCAAPAAVKPPAGLDTDALVAR